MSLSLSTARVLGLGTFALNFSAQQYGLWSTPNMKQIHDANLSFWSPHPLFIGTAFGVQQAFQMAWLWRFMRLDPNDPQQARELVQVKRYIPYYAFGNVCIATWMLFWNSSRLDTANVFVVANTAVQLWYALTQLEPLDANNWTSLLTHIVSKTFAGIGLLDLLHNTSSAYFKDEPANALVQVGTGALFAGLSLASDWILGSTLVYNLVALSVGQKLYKAHNWSGLLSSFAVGSAAIVGIRNWLL